MFGTVKRFTVSALTVGNRYKKQENIRSEKICPPYADPPLEETTDEHGLTRIYKKYGIRPSGSASGRKNSASVFISVHPPATL